jgi:diguanylate cyclase (GGDEF)-like protein
VGLLDDTAPSVRIEDFVGDDGATRPCLIVLSGHTIGRVYPIDRPQVVVGRAPEADIHIDTPGISRRHARLDTKDGEHVLTDLGSTNGTFVEGQRIETHVLSNGERLQLGSAAVLKFSIQSAVEEAFQARLYKSATHDHLTSAFNRRYFDEHLEREMSHSRRQRIPLALLVIDVDHFKRVNDTHGHQQGDEVLRQLGTLVAGSIRREDVFCRVGGEEFAVIMRDATDDAAQRFGERLRSLVEKFGFAGGPGRLPVTISIGIAGFDSERHDDPGQLVEAADQALYEAKRTGRNRVCTA